MKKKTPVIPETVADQIRLWEKERTRVKQIRSTLYDKFPSLESFLKVEQYAKSIGVHLWSSREKMILIVRQSGHEAVRNFIKRNV
jgi:transcription initiation factor TFIIH subunit 4